MVLIIPQKGFTKRMDQLQRKLKGNCYFIAKHTLTIRLSRKIKIESASHENKNYNLYTVAFTLYGKEKNVHFTLFTIRWSCW
jgi:hypothetical protein